MAAPCAPLHCVRGPVRTGGHGRPLNRIFRLHRVSDVVIFDGVCNLCAHSVQFILNHESGPILRFVPLQSSAGARMMREFGFSPDDAKSFVLVSGGKSYVKSDAAIRVAGYLHGVWRLMGALRFLPRPVRDYAYDVVARNRYRWFGRTESCMVPTPELRARFVQE